MGHLNPMFLRNGEKKADKKVSQNVRKPAAVRKKRSDAKKDIKVPMSIDGRKTLRSEAYKCNSTTTKIATEKVVKSLKKDCSYPEVIYLSSEKTVHVKLDQYFYELLQEKAIEWDCSVRKAAHRILSFELSGGYEYEIIQFS